MPYDSQPSKWPVERWVQGDQPVLYAGMWMGLKEASFGKSNFICFIIAFCDLPSPTKQLGGQNLCYRTIFLYAYKQTLTPS